MSPDSAVNRDALLAQFGGDVELLSEIIAIFLEDHVDQIRQIRSAISNRQSRELEIAAHTLKGSIGNFGPSPARDTAEALECMGKAESFEGAAEAFDGLLTQVDDVTDALQQIRDAA